MRRLRVPYVRERPRVYSSFMHAVLHQQAPARRLDLMCAHALIEARSCERFELLAARLPPPLGAFYESLQHSEARHYELYVRLAQAAEAVSRPEEVHARIGELAQVEAQLATQPDEQLRFHSGPPLATAC